MLTRTTILLTLGLVAATLTIPLALAEPGPCPGGGYSCTPPEPCGWVPNPLRDPVGYARFWPNCLLNDAAFPEVSP